MNGSYQSQVTAGNYEPYLREIGALEEKDDVFAEELEELLKRLYCLK